MTETIAVEEYFGYGNSVPYGSNWTFPSFESNKIFDISTRGDQLFLYCLGSDEEPHFIWGISFNGPWAAKNMTDYSTDTSALPDELMEKGNVELPHCDNYLYRDPNPRIELNRTLTKLKFADPANYQCNNETRYELQAHSAAVDVSDSTFSWLALIGTGMFSYWI